ncbi:MAG TPA: bacillithiol biosynthesis deacetylase BshB1 [Bacteroidia bacterium]|nr:bacillithiol biosynthesis deacetylase BshB1 [Bacteroidia bacterium]
MPVDILAFGIHPDDVELSCSGTLLRHIQAGYSAGIIDLSQGELGSRGNAELRLLEAEKAAKILGVSFRENLGMEDGFFGITRENKFRIIEKIRQHRPKIVLCNALSDRHPDHGRAAQLVAESCFYSGLRKIETGFDKEMQEPWRPAAVYHYIQDHSLTPDLVVDVTPYFEKKVEAINAFSSQFYDPSSKEPATPISSLEFMESVKAKMRVWGRVINVEFAEGFNVSRTIGVDDLVKLK